MIEYGLNDTIQIEKKVIEKLYSFTPSDMKFQTNGMPKEILAKFLLQKKLVRWYHSYVKYTLALSFYLQETPLGRKFLASSTMQELCTVFGKEDAFCKRLVSFILIKKMFV